MAQARAELLAATEGDLTRIQAAVTRRRDPLHGTAEIALAVGAVIDRNKMAKHFALDISDTSFSFARKDIEIAPEAATDGIYVTPVDCPAAVSHAPTIWDTFWDTVLEGSTHPRQKASLSTFGLPKRALTAVEFVVAEIVEPPDEKALLQRKA